MLNRWEGPVECEDPQYGRWGGKPESGTSEPSTNVAQDTAFTKRDAVDLASAITDEKFSTGSRTPDGPHKVNLPDPPKARKGMCACTSLTSSPLPPAGVVLGVFGLVMAAVGRRRRS